MFCPQCGHQRVSEETNYCSKCGFLLTAAADLIRNGGTLPGAAPPSTNLSARKRGVRQGIFLMLLTFLVAPLLGALSVAFRFDPSLAGAATVLFLMGGLMRIVYAKMFESPVPGSATVEDKLLTTARANMIPISPASLPPVSAKPADQYFRPTGNWRDTNDLAPSSVTENTTKLLSDDEAA